jgi:hypothetical protein
MNLSFPILRVEGTATKRAVDTEEMLFGSEVRWENDELLLDHGSEDGGNMLV